MKNENKKNNIMLNICVCVGDLEKGWSWIAIAAPTNNIQMKRRSVHFFDVFG